MMSQTTFAQKIYRLYGTLCSRTYLYRLNSFLYHLSLRGLGILNYQDQFLTGERSFIQQILSQIPSPVVFDVGANVGKYTAQILKAIPEAQIYAFEPHPTPFRKLQELAALQGFDAFNLACGNHSGEVKLFDYAGNDVGSSHASLHKEVLELFHQSMAIDDFEVRMIALDDFIAQNGIRDIDLLKIDTEGSELEVLNGISNTLNEGRIRMIHFEFNEMNVISRSLAYDFYRLLDTFVFYRMLPNGIVPLGNYSPIKYEIYAYQNLLAVHKNHLSLCD